MKMGDDDEENGDEITPEEIQEIRDLIEEELQEKEEQVNGNVVPEEFFRP